MPTVHILKLPAPLHHIETACGIVIDIGTDYGDDRIATDMSKVTCDGCKLYMGVLPQDWLKGSPEIQMLNLDGDKVTVSLAHGMVGHIAQALVGELDAMKVENYIEMVFHCTHPDGHVIPVEVTIRRNFGKTPHELRLEAERRLANIQGTYAHDVNWSIDTLEKSEARVKELEAERAVRASDLLEYEARVHELEDENRALKALCQYNTNLIAREHAEAQLKDLQDKLTSCACCQDSVDDAPVLCETCAPSYTRYSDGSGFCDTHEPKE